MQKIISIAAGRLKTACIFLKKYRTAALFAVGLFFFAISFFVIPQRYSAEKDARKLERKIHLRQNILEEYAVRALEMPVNQWLHFEDFPEDMVIYKYNDDTLQSWVNQFPIGNDDVDVLPLWYQLHYLNSANFYTTPLAYLSAQEQYVNLGSAWYVVKVYKKERVKVITGLLIKTEYLSSSPLLESRINPALGTYGKLFLTPVNSDEGTVIEGKDGGVLFSAGKELSPIHIQNNNIFKWLSVLFLFLSFFSFFYNRKNGQAFLLYLLGLTVLRLICFKLGEYMRLDTLLFSPNLYADAGIFSSLGNLLLNNLYVFLIALAFYMFRRSIILFYNRFRGWKKVFYTLSAFVPPALLFIYIDYTLRSLIHNSNITLELYRLEELNIYSILCYVSYGLLFIGLLLLLQLALPAVRPLRSWSLFKTKSALAYLFIISVYMLAIVSHLGFEKECERAKVWTNKLSVERDMGLELQLRFMEGQLRKDPVIRDVLTRYQMEKVSAVNSSLYLQNHMEDTYFQSVNQKYEIRLTICRPNDTYSYSHLVNCKDYYDKEITLYGHPLADNSDFYFLNNYDGRVSYLGAFTYYTILGEMYIFIELDSRFTKDALGYPGLLFDYKQADNFNMPSYYSYAKYINNRMIIYRGRYNYPITLGEDQYKNGFSIVTRDGYLHFVNKFSPDNVIVISRVKRTVFPYIVSFSYLMLFYAAMLFLFIRVRKVRKRAGRLKLPKYSFRRKITYLLTTALAISLICMGAGSVWLSLNFFRETNRSQMEEKLQTVQAVLSDFCKYAGGYTEINSADMYRAMDQVANNIQVDVNLYDPHGSLIRSTQPELFERFLLASRIDHDAYYDLIYLNKKQVIHNEKIADLTYYSLYAPVFNNSGKLIAIVNIPYFTKADFKGDVSSIVAAVINVYILLLLLAILGGTMISNSLSRPLAEISRNMQFIDVSKKAGHINYKNKDELGVLVAAYNKMVDDLEESTARLAQTEREHAWSEMARQIVHEIKNPLTPMRLSIQHLVMLKQRNVPGWEEKFEGVANSILEQIEILSDTVSEFSSFAKFYYEENAEINLYTLINEQKILFDSRENIRISFIYESEKCFVFARKGQISRVIVNLLTNAVQALEAEGGYIRISLREEEGQYEVSVEDNGSGVKEEDVKKLFRPNFTTKSSGTGLGLAISRNIIEQSGGRIFYSRSELGGADFFFRLPKYTPPAS